MTKRKLSYPRPSLSSPSSPRQALWAVGMMSGTSLDGVDVALMKTDGMSISDYGPSLTLPYPSEFQQGLRQALGKSQRDESIASLERELTLYHAQALQRLQSQTPIVPELIGFHGQTISHQPDKGWTWQIGDGQLLANLTHIKVIHDFRSADVRGGGQGAPLVPIYHYALATKLAKPLVIVNLGGVSNLTWMDERGAEIPFAALDCGPCNGPINDFMMDRLGIAYDKDGEIAAKGKASHQHLANWQRHEWFRRPFPRSLDRNQIILDGLDSLSTEDGAASLTEFSALCVVRAIEAFKKTPQQIIMAGGGRLNRFLCQRLANLLSPIPLRLIEDSDLALAGAVNGDSLEAQAFAFLAVRSYYHLSLSFPLTTGVAKPTRGGRLYHPS